MRERFEVKVVRRSFRRGCDVLIKLVGETERGGLSIVQGLTIKEVPPDNVIEPTFSISDKEAQSLMDDLWAAGYRPVEGAGSAGSMAATQKHLEDMRKIAGKYLDLQL